MLEASGVADPGGIFMTFNGPDLRDRIRLDSVTCVVDAEQAFAYPEYPALMDLKLRQVGFSDLVVLNKVGVAGTEQVEKVKAWLDEHFNRLRIIETDYCDVPTRSSWGWVTLSPPVREHILPPPRGMVFAATTLGAVTEGTRVTTRRRSAPGATRPRDPCRWPGYAK